VSFTNGARRQDGRDPKIGRFGAQLSCPRHAEACPGPEHHRTLDSNTPDKRCSAIKAKGKNAQFYIWRLQPAASSVTQQRALPLQKNLPRSAKQQPTRWRNSLMARPKPVIKNGRFKLTVAFIRTGARESSSWPGVRSTSRPDTFLQTTSDILEFLLDTKRRTIHFICATKPGGLRRLWRATVGLVLRVRPNEKRHFLWKGVAL
jgi:hypothetical protein